MKNKYKVIYYYSEEDNSYLVFAPELPGCFSDGKTLVEALSIITISAVLTALGIYDNIGQIAKCGIAIPISGFANSCVSSAMEYKKEGIVLGIGSNCLKLAGSVIVLGSFTAVVLNIIRFIIEVLK